MQLNRASRPALSVLRVSTRSVPTVALTITADLLALGIAGLLSVWVRLLLNGQFGPSLYWQLLPLCGLFIVAYGAAGLYPGVAISPVDELRRVSVSTSLVYFVLGSTVFLRQEGEVYSRGIYLISWLLSIVMVLASRALTRHFCAHQRWWGYPVVVLGAGKTGEMWYVLCNNGLALV